MSMSMSMSNRCVNPSVGPSVHPWLVSENSHNSYSDQIMHPYAGNDIFAFHISRLSNLHHGSCTLRSVDY